MSGNLTTKLVNQKGLDTKIKSSALNVTDKKGTLYLAMFDLWAIAALMAAPAMWRTFSELTTVPARVLFVPFVACLLLFWFYGTYHLVFLLFAYAHKPNSGFKPRLLGKDGPFPKAAIIYTTFNDFNREAVLTCLAQDYPNYHLFLVDVSTSPDYRAQTDAFCREFPLQVTLVRLQPRQGFKARSLNDALKTMVGEEYELFAVCDADNRLPANFLSLTIPYFFENERMAFVQANHRSSGLSQEKFARDFEAVVNASWYLHQRPRDRYGMVMCMGHGVVIRREAWAKVGGYPEIVQEDTAFTMRLRQYGYYGCFAPEVVSSEDFPEDFRRWQRRQFRLVQADAEILTTQMPGFLKNRAVSFVEKIDILVRSVRLPSQSVSLPFLALFVLVPLLNGGGLSAGSYDDTFSTMLSPAVVTVTLLAAAAPLYPLLVYHRRHLFEFLSLSLRGVTLHLSVLSLAFVSLAAFLLRGSAFFAVTGAAAATTVEAHPQSNLSRFLQRLNANSPLITFLNIGSGLAIGYLGIVSGGLVLFGVGLVLLSTPALLRLDWQRKPVSLLAYLPSLLILVGIVVGLLGITGPRSQVLVLAVLSVLLF